LEASGLSPAPPANRRTLIRRVSLDLIGLPPTPEEVNAFVNDKSPNAWEKVIDRLLASPRYGERWGRHWLDVARYADSNGLDENKAFAYAFRYRDYVIDSFNEDKPYDRFITEQIAGDLLPASDQKTRNTCLTATGFLVLGAKVLAEQDKDKMVMDIVDEQIEVISKSVMGLTVACARCHDHKFDPIATKDYYALAGILKSTRTMKNLGFVSEWMERPLSTPEDDKRIKDHETKLADLASVRDQARKRAYEETVAAVLAKKDAYLATGTRLSKSPGRVSLAEANLSADAMRLLVEAEKFDRGNLLKDFENYGKGIGVIHNGNLPDEAEWDVSVPKTGTYQIEFRYASGESRPVKISVDGKMLRENACGQVTGSFGPDGQRWEVIGAVVLTPGKHTVRMAVANHPIPHFDKLALISVPTSGAQPVADAPVTADQLAKEAGLEAAWIERFAQEIASKGAAGLTADQVTASSPIFAPQTLKDAHFLVASRKTAEAADKAYNEFKANGPERTVVMAVEESDKIGDVRVHVRGSTLNQTDIAPRRFLTVLGGDKSEAIGKDRSGRLDLANWLMSGKHPLTSRVAVNRVWQAYFGEGIVRTSDNFGLLGTKPSHPELLDWLAATFVEKGWSFKQLHKLILTSNTYKMSVTQNAKAEQIDPGNQLLWRMNLRRLEAEPFRDSILFVAGKLDTTMYGSLLATKDNDYVTNDQSGNGARYDLPRRSVYLPIIRNALFDQFLNFDVGDPTLVNAQRVSTTVAPQALFSLNSPFAISYSKAFADSLLDKKDATDIQRVNEAYQRAFSRPPTQAEVDKGVNYIKKYAASLTSESNPETRTAAAWANYCQALLASNEFIYRQ
jgi:hypothetical protein